MNIHLIECSKTVEGILHNIYKEKAVITKSDAETLDPEKKDIILYEWPSNSPDLGVLKTKKLRSKCDFKDIPIILIAPKTELPRAKKALTAGATDILLTPLQPDQVEAMINKYLKPVGKKVSINADIINPFIKATINVLGTMAGKEVKRTDLFLKKDYKMFGDISGVMGLSGEAEGSVAITFSYELAKEIVAAMLGIKPEELSVDDMRDGVGEIVNMISGSAKVELANTKYHFQISLPTIVMGPGHEIAHKKGTPCIVIVFETEGKKFAVQVSLAPKSDST